MSQAEKKTCSTCVAVVPRGWMNSGWLRMQMTYRDGSKRTTYSCPECRKKEAAAWEPKQAAESKAKEGAV